MKYLKTYENFDKENKTENNNKITNALVEEIKSFLISEDEYDASNWEQFVDKQEMGECQSIVSAIVHKFGDRGVKKVFGEIEVDEPSIQYDEDEEGETIESENYNFTHHWVEISGKMYDFSKGTLKDNIEWLDVYDPSTENEE